MSYIGSTPTSQNFIAGTDYFNGTGSQTAFTLSRTVSSANDIQATVNNVVQQPNDAYTISGTTITFTSAPSAGTGNIYVRYLSTTTQSITPSQGTVNNASFGNVTAIPFVAGPSLGAGNASIMKNRIINGAMVISQRNGTSSVTPTNGQYVLDRFQYNLSQTSKITTQQSTTAPIGFVNSLLATSSSAYSVTSTDYFTITQPIEGFNVADLGWGTANAKTVTLSAWVYSSLTGTFGGSILNGSFNYAYPFSYTISSANTWTQISVTIAGPTAGTWTIDNSASVQVNFSLGSGSTRSGTAGAWNGSFLMSATGATSVVGTSGATFYITGVQLEVGSSATGFEYENYTLLLAKCQRYCYALTAATGGTVAGNYIASSATGANWTVQFPVQARTPPTGVTTVGNWYLNNYGPGSAGVGSLAFIAGTIGTITLASNGNVVAGGGQTVGVGGVVTAYGGSATFYTTGSEL